MNAWLARAIQFSIFPSPPWDFDPSPLAGEGGDGGEKHGLGTPPACTPTLTLPPLRGGEKTDRRGAPKMNDPGGAAPGLPHRGGTNGPQLPTAAPSLEEIPLLPGL